MMKGPQQESIDPCELTEVLAMLRFAEDLLSRTKASKSAISFCCFCKISVAADYAIIKIAQ